MFKTELVIPMIVTLSFCPVALAGAENWQPVQGTAVHYESEGIEHAQTITETGFVRVSTDIVELSGDLRGRTVFQPVSVANLAEGTIVNTGSQVFSGTVLDSDPVILYDDGFRFDINVATGMTTGEIFLVGRVAGPIVRCVLQMKGTGRTFEGYNLSNYWGRCKLNHSL